MRRICVRLYSIVYINQFHLKSGGYRFLTILTNSTFNKPIKIKTKIMGKTQLNSNYGSRLPIDGLFKCKSILLLKA